ncbi:Hypothetical predicted protein [Mytilus galloprovincialis]|uniref:B box-type domain-containing protein n=1 Tax=Mytilus galloprovincialis TaxID=29158 RepID=A0A8B6GMX9_MYTGA|nr:Hypothetical predicted protein [Mytilus galloprovincialis]
MAQEAKVDTEFTIPSVCQICDTSSNIKWMCFECDLFFCLQCESKFHTKSKTLAAHSKIDIEKCGTKNIAEVIRKECGQTICTNCVMTNSHKDHTLNSIEEAYDGKVQEMKKFQKRIQSEIPLYQKTEDNLKGVLAEAFKQYSYIKEHITWKEKEIIKETKHYAKKLLDTAETEWKTIEQKINQEVTVVNNITENFEKEREIRGHTLPVSKLLTKTFPTIDNTYSPEEEVHQIKLLQHYFTFQSFKIKDIFGYLSKGPGFKLVKTYETSLRGFTKILPLNNNQAIISCWEDEVLQKVNFGKKNMTVETNYPKIKVYDIAVMKNGDILLSKQEGELKLLCEKGAIESFHSFSPFKTFGIHVNNENDIVVGLASSSDGGDGKIVVLDSNGIVKRTFENDKDKDKLKLISCPLRIVTNVDNSICFIEKSNNGFSNSGAIVAIDEEGKLKWASTRLGSSFHPADLSIILSSGLIVVTSYSYRCNLHVLNQKGKSIFEISVAELFNNQALFGFGPLSTAIDSEGMMFLADYSTDNYRERAKIATFKN